MKSAATTIASHSDLTRRLRVGVSWNLAGAIFGQGSTFAANIVLANILGRVIFGEFALVQNTLFTLSGVAQLATGYTASKYVAEFRTVDKERTGRVLGICSLVSLATAIIGTLALIVLGPWLAVNTLNAPQLGRTLMLSSGFVLFSITIGFQMGALAGLENYKSLAQSIVTNGACYLIFCSAFAKAWGIVGALFGMIAAAVVQCIVLQFFLKAECGRQGIKIQYRKLEKERAIFFRFALPAALAGFVSMPTMWLANTTLARQANGFAGMALYSAATSLTGLVLFLPNLINRVSVSVINNQRGLRDESGYRKVFWGNIALTGGAAIVAATALALAGPFILGLYGRSFREGYPVLLALLFSAIPETVAAGAYHRIQSHERMWLSLLVIVIPRSITMVAFAFVLSPRLGALGLGMAYAAAQLYFCLSVCVLVWQLHRRDPSSKLL